MTIDFSELEQRTAAQYAKYKSKYFVLVLMTSLYGSNCSKFKRSIGARRSKQYLRMLNQTNKPMNVTGTVTGRFLIN